MAGFSNEVMYANNVNFSGAKTAAVTTNGQLLIGSTASPNIRVGTLSSSNGTITINNGAGTIDLTVASGTGTIMTLTGNTGGAISPTAGNINIVGTGSLTSSGLGSTITFSLSGGGFTWTDVTGATQALSIGNGYLTDRGAGVTYTLPATAALGDVIKIDGKLGLTTIAQNANQAIRMGASLSTTGAGGSVVGTNVGDCITLRCSTAGASTIWIAENWVGSWTVT